MDILLDYYYYYYYYIVWLNITLTGARSVRLHTPTIKMLANKGQQQRVAKIGMNGV